MSGFILWDGSVPLTFVSDKDAGSGIMRVARKVMKDYDRAAGISPVLISDGSIPEVKGSAVLFANEEDSELLKELESKNLISLEDIRGKREVFKITAVRSSGSGAGDLLVIAGSDRLGTIYGLFTLSEYMGVSPLACIADGAVPRQSRIVIPEDAFGTSSEPSVRFRGFFINDEWPCFGNWTFDHFGGFTAEMYDLVFELLLRLKGNYLWPAMWSSSFALDGPGLANYELASEYGIYIGNSHHEPCLRAGEEYSKVRGPESIYGDAWSFLENEQGITRFWKDSLDERGGFTSVVTVGMRGEADTTILGANSTLKDNIDLLKNVITCQKKLLKETEEKFNKKFPKLLALYKEVEPFYYGDENTPGLIDWDGLDDVILMLCEDNHNYVRTLPGPRNRNHPGGFGMYYHVDYHGDPISYEWINSTPIVTIWEQMRRAYDYGVRDVWILNVGDLKHNEFPLSFFMELAYSIDSFKERSSLDEYTLNTVAKLLGISKDSHEAAEAAWILTETVRINGIRRPEALNPGVYSPCHSNEAERMLRRVELLEEREKKLVDSLDTDGSKAWFSLSGFQTRATVNLQRMHLYAGINNMLAGKGLKNANRYADLVTETIDRDNSLKKEWASFNGGEWKGMELASHIGFTKWNDDGCKYPLRCKVEPLDKPHMAVRRTDHENIYDKKYGPPMMIEMDDFLYEGVTEVAIDINNTGVGSLNYEITGPECGWLTIDKPTGEVTEAERVTFRCDRSKLPTEPETLMFRIFDKDTPVLVRISGARTEDDVLNSLPEGTALEGPYGWVIPADDCVLSSTAFPIEDYGPWGMGIAAVDDYGTEKPVATYRIYSDRDLEAVAAFAFAPSAPLFADGKLRFELNVNGTSEGLINTVPDGYRPGNSGDRTWALGALEHHRKVLHPVRLKKGVNEIAVTLTDPGLVLLRTVLFDKDKEIPQSYLGPQKSYIKGRRS